MNLIFYEALARIPLDLTVTLEFRWPARRRHRRIAFAAIGIALIAPWQAASAIDRLGVVIALRCWATYIVLGSRVSLAAVP